MVMGKFFGHARQTALAEEGSVKLFYHLLNVKKLFFYYLIKLSPLTKCQQWQSKGSLCPSSAGGCMARAHVWLNMAGSSSNANVFMKNHFDL